MGVDLTVIKERQAELNKASPQERAITKGLSRLVFLLLAICFMGFFSDETLSRIGSAESIRQTLWMFFGLALALLGGVGFSDAKLTGKVNRARERQNLPAFEYTKSQTPPYIALTDDYAYARRQIYKQQFWAALTMVIGLLVFIKNLPF